MDTVIRLILALAVLFIAFGIFAYLIGRNMRVYVAIMLHKFDGSGKTTVVGVYRKRESAESKLFNSVGMTGRPSAVVECVVNKDISDPEEL